MSDQALPVHPDYWQVSSDHRRLLVLVKSISPTQLKPKVFARVFEVLDRCHAKVAVNSADDLTRHVEVRFVRSYPIENLDWADFQHHRAVLGMVSVGAYSSQDELNELSRLHEAMQQKYAKSLLCSRLIALKEEEVSNTLDTPTTGKESEFNYWIRQNSVESDADSNTSPSHQPKPRRSTTNSPHDKLEYSLGRLDEKSLENDISAFVTTMFWLLEKTRVEKTAMDASSKLPPLLCAPFEKRDFVGLDMESRTNKRRTMGRFKKHLGDLNLMCGLPREAYDFYETAADTLKSCNDWLWYANSMEGMTSIAASVHYPAIDRIPGLRRNSSFQALNHIVSPKRKEREGIDTDEEFKRRVLSKKRLVDAMKESVSHYSKYRHAGVMETEACIKAVQILIAAGEKLEAADFLQNVVFINLNMNEEEKVLRFATLSKLYAKLGFVRKAAFFHRVAAMRCVAPQNPNTDWQTCYSLLLKTLTGYNINFLEPEENGKVGWPSLQIQILQELVGTARRMGDLDGATRHLAFIIQNFFTHLSNADRADMCQQLGVLTSKNVGRTIMAHPVENGIILPPVNLYTVPQVTLFQPCPLSEPLVPPSSGTQDRTFIFTPIQSGAKKSKIVSWVQGEVANVTFEVANPLGVELKISELALLHEGVDFDAFATSHVLPPHSGPTQLKLSGVPKGSGQLRLLGYTCIVFGVRSNCKVKSLGLDMDEDSIPVDVCPCIPRLDKSLFDHSSNLVASNDLDLELYHGESKHFVISLQNASTLPVEQLSTSLRSKPLKYAKCVSMEALADSKIRPGDKKELKVMVSGPSTQCLFQDVAEEEEADEPISLRASTAAGDKFHLEVVVKYSSDFETSQGYSRQLVQKCRVSLQESLITSWWDILPGETADECYMVLDVKNLAENEAEVHFGANKKIVIDCLGTCRIPVPVEKIPSERGDESVKNKFLANYLDQAVNLSWEFPSEGRRGRISLADINLTPAMMARLEKSSLTWTVFVNGDQWVGMDFHAKAGQILEVCVKLQNHYLQPIRTRFSFSCEYVIDGTNSMDKVEVPVTGRPSQTSCQPGEIVNQKGKFIPCLPGKICISAVGQVLKEVASDITSDPIHIPNIYAIIS